MIRWLRRRQPRNVALAVLYWLVIAAATVVILGLFFFYVVDPIFPSSF